jgi:hypothetical protein
MRKILLSENRFLVYYGALRGNPEGFKGMVQVRNAMKILDKLEAFGVEHKENGYTFLKPDVGEAQLELTEEEFALLKGAMEATPWTGQGIRIAEDAFLGLEQAQ